MVHTITCDSLNQVLQKILLMNKTILETCKNYLDSLHVFTASNFNMTTVTRKIKILFILIYFKQQKWTNLKAILSATLCLRIPTL